MHVAASSPPHLLGYLHVVPVLNAHALEAAGSAVGHDAGHALSARTHLPSHVYVASPPQVFGYEHFAVVGGVHAAPTVGVAEGHDTGPPSKPVSTLASMQSAPSQWLAASDGASTLVATSSLASGGFACTHKSLMQVASTTLPLQAPTSDAIEIPETTTKPSEGRTMRERLARIAENAFFLSQNQASDVQDAGASPPSTPPYKRSAIWNVVASRRWYASRIAITSALASS